MDFDFETYKGPYVAVPEPLFEAVLTVFALSKTDYYLLKKCTTYEPDNHHNAALCPYCSPEAMRKKNLEAYEKELTTSWCEVDGCLVSICHGPHREVKTSLGLETLRYDQEPIGKVEE